MTKNRLIAFDGDCTLYDTRFNLMQSTHEAFRTAGYSDIGRLAIMHALEQGHGPKQIFSSLTPEADSEELEKLFYEADAALGFDNVTLFPGVVDCLKELSYSGYEIGIVTNRAHSSTKYILERLGIDVFFVSESGDKIIGGDDVSEPKPSPEGLKKLIRETGFDATKTVFVGDTSGDIIAARLAEVRVIGFSNGLGSPSGLSKYGASALFSDYNELPDLL